MKTWTKPEMKVMNIRMNENIATSGDQTRPIDRKIITLNGSGGDGKAIIKYCAYYSDTMTVITTSIPAGNTYTDNSRTASEITQSIDDAGCHGGMA